MPKVSVIIPVYNVEQYIERCARSLFEQTLDDIEYIFVNDCTPDNSMAILTKIISDYPTRTAQIKIVNHDVNKGLPTARHSGLAIATGDYVIHCDSDDYIKETMYEEMYMSAAQDGADMLICNYKTIKGDYCETVVNPIIQDDNISVIKNMLSGKVHHYVWACLIKRDIYSENVIAYPQHTVAEDFVLMIQAAYYAKKIKFLNIAPYHYIIRSESSSNGISKSKILKISVDVIENTKAIIGFLDSVNLSEELKTEIRILKYAARISLRPLLQEKEYYKKWRAVFPELDKEFLKDKNISLLKKISFLLSYLRIEPYYRPIYTIIHRINQKCPKSAS